MILNENKVSALFLKLIEFGLISIRNSASGGDAALCAIEADHLHNLPIYALNPQENLSRYLKIDVPEYLEKVKKISTWSDSFSSISYPGIWVEMRKLLNDTP